MGPGSSPQGTRELIAGLFLPAEKIVLAFRPLASPMPQVTVFLSPAGPRWWVGGAVRTREKALANPSVLESEHR